MLDATQKFGERLTKERLFDWHANLFPEVRKTAINSGWELGETTVRDQCRYCPGQSVAHKIHYEAPMAAHIDSEMRKFLKWLDSNEQEDPLLKASIAHLWFVTIHPFEDGNGRIGRAIAEMCLARSDGGEQRFYSMSSQILEERKGYYDVLERTQAGSPDITEWLTWFLGCLDRAI